MLAAWWVMPAHGCLPDVADKTGLTRGFVQALGLDRVRRPAHEPGRVAVDLAVLLADGGEAIADVAKVRRVPSRCQ